MAIAHTEFNNMVAKGLSISKLGTFTTRKVLEAILVPTITYTTESIPMDLDDYQYIEDVVDGMISKVLNIEHTPQWATYELGMMPTTLIIQRNKIDLYRKAKTEDSTLLGILVNAIPNNFLEREIQDIAGQWDIVYSLNSILQTKSKTNRKEKVKENMIRVKHSRMTEQLSHTWWAEGETKDFAPQHLSGTLPSILAMKFTTYRAKYLLEEMSLKKCPHCAKDYRNNISHLLQDCTDMDQTYKRRELNEMTNKEPRIIRDTMASLDKNDKVKAYLGLIDFETNLSEQCFDQVIETLSYLG